MSTPKQSSVFGSLQLYTKGQRKEIDIIIRQLQSPSCKDAFMVQMITEFKNSVSFLTKDHFEIVVAEILKLDWTNRAADVIKVYHTFLINLVSAHSIYTQAVLLSLLSRFVYKERASVANGMLLLQLDIEQRKAFEEEMKNVHSALASVIKAVPMSVQILHKLVTELFPYVGHPSSLVIEAYVQNILHMTFYCPSLRTTVLAVTIEKMIYLDVRAPRGLIDDEENSNLDDDDGMEMFDMDAIDGVDVKQPTNKIEEADRLDTLMCLALNFIDRICYTKDGELDWQATKSLYLEMLTIFEKSILPTHQSCHTQFLLFYICSLRQDLAVGFIDYLWKKFKNPNEHQLYRKYAMFYLASFIVRARFVSISTAADAITLICEWVQKYITNVHVNAMQCDIQHHGPFYSAVQSVFYMLAFRQREFIDMDNAQSFFINLGLQTMVTCRLNPLRVCQPVVTRTFSAFVRKHQLAFCDSIIERNNRLVLPCVSGSGDGSDNYLDTYFPFDPYLLIRSEIKISPLYRPFEGNAIVCMEPDMADVDGDEEDEFVTESFMSPPIAKSPMDAFLGSVSPGFNHMSR